MVSRLTIILWISLAICISRGYGHCLQGPLKKQVTKYGTAEEFCEYEGLKIAPGAKFRLTSPSCLDCSCSKSGLSCCGFGFAAGQVGAPPGCVAENDACKIVFVQEKDHSQKCRGTKSTKPVVSNKKPIPPGRR